MKTLLEMKVEFAATFVQWRSALFAVIAGAMLSTPASAVVTPGAIDGAFNATEAGAAVFSIPVALPPGTATVVPGISLTYTSQGDNGLVGQGFDIRGLPAVSRCSRTLVTDGVAGSVNFDANDRFCLSGQRLMLITGSYGGDGAEYHAEIDSYEKVISYGVAGTGPAWFKIWTKSGLIFEYGNSIDSRIEAQGKTTAVVWALNKVYDRVGNYYTVTYVEDNATGQYYPSRIDYTGNVAAGLAPYASVRFAYEARTDIVAKYMVGSVMKSTVRLAKIQTYTSVANVDSLVREYRATYLPTDAILPSRLQSVTECGFESGLELCLPPTTFTWQGGGTGAFALASNFVPPTSLEPSQYKTVRYPDVNGDGKADYCFRDSQGIVCYPSGVNLYTQGFRGPAWSDANGWANGANSASYYSTIQFPDLNADGKADVCARTSTGIVCYIGTGTGFTSGIITLIMTDALGWKDARYFATIQFPDINGDGKADLCARDAAGIICYTGNGQGVFALAFRGPAWSDAAGWGANWDTTKEPKYFTTIQYPDLNGDALSDVCGRSGSGVQCALNTGTGFGAPFALHSAAEALSDAAGWGKPEYYSTISYPDLNNDGNADICARASAGVSCWLSIGAGGVVTFKFSGPAWSDGAGWNNAKYYATIQYPDVNGDAITDICARNGAGIECWIGTGASFISKFSGPAMSDPYYNSEQAYSSIRFTDFDGDSKTDVCEAGRCWNCSFIYGSGGGGPVLLSMITDGLGKQIKVTYKPLTDSAVYTRGNTFNSPASATITRDVQTPLYVVATTEATQPWVSNATTSRANYKYEAAKAENRGRGYLGFAAVVVTDPDSGIINRSELRQDFPFIGHVKRSERRLGVVKLFEADHTGGVTFRYGGKVYDPKMDKTITKNYEQLDASLLSTVTTTTAWDPYGNPQRTTVTTVAQNLVTGVSETHTDVLERFYLWDTTNWLIGKLIAVKATRTLPDLTSQTRESSFTYDATTGLLKQEVIEPNNATLKRTKNYLAYDAFGNPRNVTETGVTILDRQDLYNWDTRGRFMTYHNNRLASWFEYDERFGATTRFTDANSLQTNTTYDGLGRKKTQIGPDGTAVTYTYSSTAPIGCVTCVYGVTASVRNGGAVVSPDTSTYFDFLNRQVRVDVPQYNGQMTLQATEYDNRGRTYRTSRRVVDNNNWTNYYWTTYTYDGLDRVKTVTSPDNSVTSMAYNGLTATITYPNTFSSTRINNGTGQLIKVTNPIDASRSTSQLFTYDPFGNLRTSKDSAGNAVTMTYDVMGRKLTQSDPDLGNWSWNYYPYNFVKDAVLLTTPLGSIETRFDALGRTIEYKTSDLTVDWFYDTAPGKGQGQLSWTQTSAGYKRTYAYDSLGRTQKVDTTIDGVIYSTQTTYDAASRLDTVTYPKGLKVKHTYNNLGFPYEVQNATTYVNYWKMYSMTADGNVNAETLGNGRWSFRQYNESTGRVERIQTGNGFDAATQDATYTWDNMGNLRTRADVAAGISEGPFTYDAMNRLTSSPVAGMGTKSYSYDDLGNLTNRSDVGTYVYSGPRPHAVKSVSGAINRSYSYDNNGNMLSDGVRNYAWTKFNMPTTIIKGGQTTSFTYGSERQRIKQVSPSRTVIYAGSGFEAEMIAGVTTYKNYVAAGNGLVAIVTQDAAATITATRYLHRDHLGSPSVVTNETGAVMERLSYEPYGKRRNSNGTDDTGNALTSAQSRSGFTGHEQLDDLDLVHMNGRIYDPTIARFVSPDPLVQAPQHTQSYNRYAYVFNNPLTNIDPSGYKTIFERFGDWLSVVTIKNTVKLIPDFHDVGDAVRDNEALRTVAGAAACYYGGPAGCAAYNAYVAKLQGASNIDALNAGAMSAGMSVAFMAVGDMGYGSATWQNALAHGAVGGIFGYAASGGDLAATRSGFGGAFVGEYYSNYGMGGAMLGGGVGSQLSGGTFWSGVRTGAYGYIFNFCAHNGCFNREFLLSDAKANWQGGNGSPITDVGADEINLDGAGFRAKNTPNEFQVNLNPATGSFYIYGTVTGVLDANGSMSFRSDTYNFDYKNPFKGQDIGESSRIVIRDAGTAAGRIYNGNGTQYKINFSGSQTLHPDTVNRLRNCASGSAC